MKNILKNNKTFLFFYILTLLFVFSVLASDPNNKSNSTVKGLQIGKIVQDFITPPAKPNPTAAVAGAAHSNSFIKTDPTPTVAQYNNSYQQSNNNGNNTNPNPPEKNPHHNPTPTTTAPTPTPTSTPVEANPTPTPTPEIIIIDPPYPDCPKPPCIYPMPYESMQNDSIQKWPICPEYADVHCL